GRFLSVFTGEMSVPDRDAIEGNGLAAASSRFRFRSEIKLYRLPGIAGLRLQTETRGRLITAVHHAIFATRIARHAVNHSVFLPLHLLQQFGVARIMGVGHQIARAFPTANVSGWNRPSRTGQVAMTGEKFKVNWRPKKCVTLHPLLDLPELLDRPF